MWLPSRTRRTASRRGPQSELLGDPQTLRQRVTENFTTTSLTLLSIVQGVALVQLAAVVLGAYAHFTLLQWLMVAITLFLLVLVWHHMAMDALVFTWIPDFWDSAIPFLVGAVELFLAQATVLGVSLWLDGMVFITLAALVELWYVRWRAELSPDDDPQMLAFLRQRWHVQWQLTLVGLILFPVLALSSALGLFRDTPGFHATLTGGAMLLVWGWLVGFVVTDRLALYLRTQAEDAERERGQRAAEPIDEADRGQRTAASSR